MALSYYSNWDAFQAQLNLDTDTTIFAQPETHDHGWDFTDSCSIDHLLYPNNLFNYNSSENYNSLFADYFLTPTDPPSYDHNLFNPQAPFQILQDFEPFPCVKRQKASYDCEELCSGGITYGLQDYSYQEVVMPPLPDIAIPLPPVFSSGISCEINSSEKKQPTSLSAQSIAARQRRKKITAKTQELGKLIPGGQKMNTAEMFHAAYKYIKYLQTQVGILEFMNSYHKETEEQSFPSEELHVLLESPLIQEKLFSTEKCLVPQKFVQSLINDDDHEFQWSSSQVVKEIRQLIPTMEH